MPKYLGSWSIAAIALSFLGINTVAQEAPKTGSAALLEAEHEVSARIRGQAWQPGVPVLPLVVGDSVRTGLLSRATVRLTDLSVLRMNEATTIQVLAAEKLGGTEGVDIKNGALYFFSHDRPREMRIQTPVATGALRGTEFHVAVGANGRTTVTMLDGEVQLSNAHGSVLIRSGEQGEVARGQAPKKTAVIQTINIIQWCLYYPGVIDIDELKLSAGTQRRLSTSLLAYRQGDVLGALRAYPMDQTARSESEQLYRAAVLLTVGQVDKAKAQLRGVTSNSSARRALETLIAAVTYQPSEGDENHPIPGVAGGQQEGEFKSTTDKNVIDSGSTVFGNSNGLNEPRTASEWLAQSYYEQAHGHLEKALTAAKQATVLSPSFGFAWTRVAELEFSFGRTQNAARALEKGTSIAPLNAASFALRGFVLSAQNYIDQATESFERSMTLDGALGDAWLGRGLCSIRRGHDVEGRKDIQTAVVLEPTRSLFRSYLGKAFSAVGSVPEAQLELKRAIELDPKDPTPWLYSAIERKQENRYNEAIDDLEKSVELNDNRRLYRSQFLLDQDRSIRGTNLAAIYQDDGMTEQSVREAVRAVDGDYSSAPAHLFLANSYNALRDPDRILLRYETAWFNELLLSNLLSPVGGGPLSQFVSEQEYSKMFEHDGFGASSVTEYFSYGEVRETASQYGTFGNVSYSVDTQYQYSDGIRPNNWIERSETYAQFKIQIDPQDTVFFQTKFEDLHNGDVFQHYDQRDVDKTFDFHEEQDPALLLLGWHHEWWPGIHTLVLLGRLENEQTLTDQNTRQAVIGRDVSPFTAGLDVALNIQPQDFNDPFGNPAVFRALRPLTGSGQIFGVGTDPFAIDYRPKFEAYTADLQNIVTLGPDTVVFGGRYQSGQFDTADTLTLASHDPFLTPLFDHPAAQQDFITDLERINFYLYNTWRIVPWFAVTGGFTYDHLRYPDNFRSLPVNNQERELEKVSPKVGFIIQPLRGMVVRGAYLEAISGASFDESVRLEPTQVAGFTQAYRSLASESLIGSVAGSRYKIWGLSVEQKLPTRTYLGAEFNLLEQNLDRTIGVFDFLDSIRFGGNFPAEILPSSLSAKDGYREDVLTVTANQLLGDNWSVGVRYQYTFSHFKEQFPALQEALMVVDPSAILQLAQNAESIREAGLHELDIFGLFNHPSGFFARVDAKWYNQDNDTFTPTNRALTQFVNSGPPGDDFWQLDAVAGWRFYRNQCEISCGVLNITGTDYHLNPLNPYVELPRSQTFVLRAKLSF